MCFLEGPSAKCMILIIICAGLLNEGTPWGIDTVFLQEYTAPRTHVHIRDSYSLRKQMAGCFSPLYSAMKDKNRWKGFTMHGGHD